MLSRTEREELRERVDRWFDIPLILAAIALVLLIVIDATQTLHPPWDQVIQWIGLVIWAVFAVEFALRLWLSPDRSDYLKAHWLDALAVALPALRVFRIVRLARAARSLRALRLLVFGGRGASELIEQLRRRQLGKLATVTLFVILLGAGLLFLAEADQVNTPVQSFGDAVFWATIAVVGTEGGIELATLWGRVIVLALVGYSILVFSYLVGAIASLWVERDRVEREARAGNSNGQVESRE
jgi:voltage-gated potassium channel